LYRINVIFREAKSSPTIVQQKEVGKKSVVELTPKNEKAKPKNE
jgi:hypothetical protein